MFKRTAIVAAVCVVCASMAGATTSNKVKIKEFTPVGPGIDANPNADGTAHLTYDPVTDTTEVRLTITSFLPNTVYGVEVSNDAGQLLLVNDAIVTNPAGNGSIRMVALQNGTVQTVVKIFQFNGFPDTMDIVDADEERAIGVP
jgi:hypothetical protein